MRLKVLSHHLFDEEMKKTGLNDDNVENTNMAFISIIGTPECLIYYLDEGDTKHYFKNHTNVLNLEFDDIGQDVMYNGHHFKTMRMEQAEKTINFIEDNISKGIDTIIIHCRAGFSRSRAVAEFIYRYCKEKNIDVTYEDRDYYAAMYNHGVLLRLNHAYWKKHHINHYVNEGEDYPVELINPPITEINRERTKNPMN